MARNTNLIGPSSSTDNAVARYDSTTGTVLQDSGNIVEDNSNFTMMNNSSQLVAADFPNAATLSIYNCDNVASGDLLDVGGGSLTLTLTAGTVAPGNDCLGISRKNQSDGSVYWKSTSAVFDLSGSFSLGGKFLLPSWTPASAVTLISNASSATAGFRVDVSTAGNLIVYENATTPFGAAGVSVAGLDATKFHEISILRTVAGSIVVKIDGNIVATAATGTITAKQLFQVFGYNGATTLPLTGTRVDEVWVHIGTVETDDQEKIIYARSAKKFAVKDANTNVYIPELNVASGVYTPCYVSNSNVASYTIRPSIWTRTGNVVTCSIDMDITPTNAPSAFALYFTLPIACTSTPTPIGVFATGSLPQCGRFRSSDATSIYLTAADAVTTAATYGGTFQYVLN